MKDFLTECLGVPYQETETERALRELAVTYIERTEAFDRVVCTEKDKRGAARPGRWGEYQACRAHAIEVRAELEREAGFIGCAPKQLRDAINREQYRGR